MSAAGYEGEEGILATGKGGGGGVPAAGKLAKEGELPDGKGGGGGEPAIGKVAEEGELLWGLDVADPVACSEYPQLPQKVLRESMEALHFGQYIEAIYKLLQIIQ